MSIDGGSKIQLFVDRASTKELGFDSSGCEGTKFMCTFSNPGNGEITNGSGGFVLQKL